MSKCIVYDAQMIHLRIPSLPLMKDMKDMKEQTATFPIGNYLPRD